LNCAQYAPFSLRIFVADCDPDDLRIVEKSNWIAKALVLPRALLPQVKARAELAKTGVYLLLGPRPDGSVFTPACAGNPWQGQFGDGGRDWRC